MGIITLFTVRIMRYKEIKRTTIYDVLKSTLNKLFNLVWTVLSQLTHFPYLAPNDVSLPSLLVAMLKIFRNISPVSSIRISMKSTNKFHNAGKIVLIQMVVMLIRNLIYIFN